LSIAIWTARVGAEIGCADVRTARAILENSKSDRSRLVPTVVEKYKISIIIAVILTK
jgi:hypothetical protein